MNQNQIQDISLAQDKGIELEIANDLRAGFPLPASDYTGETIDLTREMVPHPVSTFYARVVGDSMQEAGIRHGDIVVVDRSLEPRNGDYVVACIDGEFTLKEYQLDRQNECVWLIPHNPNYEKIRVTKDKQLLIWGVITYSVHKCRRK